MRSLLRFGALSLAVTFIAACGSSTPATPATTASTAASSMDPSMSMPTGTMSTDTMSTDTMSTGMEMGDTPPATGLTIDTSTKEFAPGAAADLNFKIIAANGSTINEYEVEQTKELHLILVRSDLTEYQHLHPIRAADGTWSIPVTFAKGGTYRMVADFVPVIDGAATGRTAVTTDLTVTGTGTDTPLPAPASTTTVDGYTVTIAGDLTAATESDLTFTVNDAAGRPVVLEPYLGAFGHLVAFAQSDLAYKHIHPSSAKDNDGILVFTGQVTTPGMHRLFMQFAAGGSVHTAEFTANAS